ncbi:MAG: putative glycoside hydrolase [Patescibacteria group bacterium]
MTDQAPNNFVRQTTAHPYRQVVRFGMAIVLLTALPIAYYLGFEAAPETYRPLFVVEKPGSAAVRAIGGPNNDDARHIIETPIFVKGIYVSAATAGYTKRFDELVELVEQTELNTLVIDVKDHRGALAFAPETEALEPYVAAQPTLGNLQEFTAPLKEKGIYLIARLFVFQDPALVAVHPEWAVSTSSGSPWRDYKGVAWLDPASKDVWRYNATIAKEVFAGGFDEVQFDYIRFPSDGNLKSAVYPVWDKQKNKYEVMADFFTYLDKELRVKVGLPISVDLFGLTMWQHDYDLNIGQRLLEAMPHFDFISPMVYPSHYPAGFLGCANPAVCPYEVVYENMLKGQTVLNRFDVGTGGHADVLPARQLATFRPWIQDFHLGATYTPDMVRQQMTATEAGGGTGWLLWNARNVYTAEALEPAEE